MKVCKVYCTYFGERRGDQSASPKDANDALEIFKKNIQNDMEIDCGVGEMDIIVVNNYSTTITPECVEYLERIHNMETPFGKIYVHNRNNIGGSLGAYSFAFDLYYDQYDYWLFIEDDIKITYPQYYKVFIDEFKDDDKLGLLSLTIIHNDKTEDAWVSGGFGVAHNNVLKEIKKEFGKLQYDERDNLPNYGQVGDSEFLFSQSFIKLDYELRNPKNEEIIPMADNWKHFPPQVVWQENNNFSFDNKKFLYHLGH